MKSTRWLILALIIVAGAIFITGGFGSTLTLSSLQQHNAELISLRDEQPWTVALAYGALYVVVTALSLPGAAVLTLAGGALFGLLWGTVIVSFASTLGATLAFLIARFLLRDWVRGRFPAQSAAIDRGMEREGAFYLFTLRMIPVFPFFVVNLLMGLTALRVRTYFWVSQLGMLAGTVVYVNAGTQLAQIERLGDIVSPALLLSFALLGLLPWIARRIVDAVRRRKVYARWRRPARFDRNLIVIGAGSAGLVAAYIAAAIKARVTLVEKHRMGGDCLNTGCVPSKALIRSARAVAELRRAGEFGLTTGNTGVDFAQVMQRVQDVIQRVEPHDSVERYTGLGVEVIEGTARLVSPWQVEITGADGTRMLSARSIVLATGARPLVPPIPGLADAPYSTSDTVWSLRERPGRLLVLGGGPIGSELAQAFARLGSKVTQVEMGPRLLGREDPDVSELVMQKFRAEGINVRVGHKAVRFVRDGDTHILEAEDLNHDGQRVQIPFDRVLVALGRAANLRGYGLEELGIPAGRTIETNEYLETLYPNIHAAGDVAGPYQFTHTAGHQAWYASVNSLLAPFWRFKVDYRVIPWATFVEPEVARVGLNETEAHEQGIAHEVTRFGIDDLDRAIADGEAHGFVKVLTPPGKDRILGVTIVGAHAGDLIAEYVLAMRHGIGLNKILGTIHIYPTMAEANKYAAGAWKRAHAPQGLLRLAERFHAWRRG